MITEIIEVTYKNKGFILIQILSSLIIYLLVKYRFKTYPDDLNLSKKTIKNLIKTYQPEPIIELRDTEYSNKTIIKYNFSSYDIFNLSKKYKSEIKETIEKYGIGTCGPRGFYGTLDLHLQLEDTIKDIFKKESAIVYSNHYTCLQSVVASFCKPKNTVYFHRKSSEAILRGLYLSKAATIAYDSLDELENTLENCVKSKNNIPDKYVIVERMLKNTGEISDLKRVTEMRKKYGFRVILDESFTMPFMYQSGEDYGDIDIIMGSLAHGYPSNGAFSCGSIDAIDYQRLSGAGYVFSASLPAFLTKAAILFLNTKIDYTKVEKATEIAFKYIDNIVSDQRSPILLVKVRDCEEAKRYLNENGYQVGINGEYLRLCINEDTSEEAIKNLSNILNNL